MHTDIQKTGFVSRLPARWQPYAILARIDRPIGVWLLLLPGLWSIALAPGGWSGKLWLAVLFAVGAVVMRAAGCVINDFWDRDLDAQVQRTRMRPIACGAVRPRQALVFLSILLLCGLCVLLQMNVLTVLLGLAVLPLVIFYPLMKRITFWPQAFLGLTFNFGALMGWAAVTGEIGLVALCLYLCGIFWTLGYDTVYAFQDVEDDALIGVKSTALKFGTSGKLWIGGFYMAGILSLGAAFLLSAAPLWACGLCAVPASHMIWQLYTLNIDDPKSALAVFKSNRDFGFLVLAVILALTGMPAFL